jgi:hypothetical protein
MTRTRSIEGLDQDLRATGAQMIEHVIHGISLFINLFLLAGVFLGYAEFGPAPPPNMQAK